MPIKSRTTIISRILFFLIAAAISIVTAGAQDRIEWEPVEGADHYRVEIRKDGDLVLETRCDEPRLPLFLPAGEYDFRINVINAFDKVASEGEWSKIRITAVDFPFIIDSFPAEIHAGEKTDFRVHVSGYIDGENGSSFHFEGIDGSIIPLSIKEIKEAPSSAGTDAAWTEVVLSSEKKSFDEGAWNLVMTNPYDRENRMTPALRVLEKQRPRIRNVSPDQFPAGMEHNPAIVTISGMEEGSIVKFSGPSDIKAQLLSKDDKGNLEYSFNLLNAEPGWYSVAVANPSGGTDSKERVFRVYPRPPTEEELEAEAAFKIDEKEPRELSDHPHTLTFGWNMNFAVGEAAEYFSNDFIGLSVGISQDFHNDLIRRVPWLNGLGWESKVVYSRHRTEYPLYTLFCRRITFEAGIHYITPFDFPLKILLRGSTGVACSIYTSPEYNRNEAPFGTYKIRDLDSFDFTLRFGMGGRFDITSRWFIDLALDLTGTFYLSQTFWTLQPNLNGGWRW